MRYKTFQDLQLSALGMGCMRLPLKGGNSEIDEEQTARMAAYAMAHGINYFDTAWGYHGGNSESVMGKIVTIHSQPKPVKWKTKEIVFCLKANQRLSSWYDLSGCLMSYFL